MSADMRAGVHGRSDPGNAQEEVPELQEFAGAMRNAVAEMSRQNAAASQAAQQLAREWMQLAREGLERNLRLFGEIAQARTLPDLAEVQARIVREMTEAVHTSSQRLAEAAVRAAQGTDQAGQGETIAARALRSGLAHKGEPPDYAADNE